MSNAVNARNAFKGAETGRSDTKIKLATWLNYNDTKLTPTLHI